MTKIGQTDPRLAWDTALLDRRAEPVLATAWRYPGDAGIAEHAHDRGQLLYAVAGAMAVTARDRAFLVPPERALWLPAGVAHAIRCRGEVAMRSVYVRVDAARDLPMDVRVLQVTPLLRELIGAALAAPLHYAAGDSTDRLMRVILDQIAAPPPASALDLPMPRSGSLRRLAEGLLADPAERRSSVEIAAVVGMSGRTLTRRFRAECGISLGAWRRQARLLSALDLLAQGRPVTQVALDVGYDSPSAFIATFRRAFGRSPGAWRAATATGE